MNALDPIRSLKAVGRAAAANPTPFLVWWFGGLAAFTAVYLVVYLPAAFVLLASSGNSGRPEPWAIAAFAGAALVLVVVLLFAQCWWRIGLANLLADALRTGRCDLSSALRARGRLLRMIGAQLLVAAIFLAVYLPFVAVFLGASFALREEGAVGALPVLVIPVALAWIVLVAWLALGFLFVPHAVAFDGCGPVEAVRRSWGLARGRRLELLLFLLVTLLCALAGLLLFCVGYLATAALFELMPAEAYLALTRGEEYAGWWAQTGSAPGAGAPPEVPPAAV